MSTVRYVTAADCVSFGCVSITTCDADIREIVSYCHTEVTVTRPETTIIAFYDKNKKLKGSTERVRPKLTHLGLAAKKQCHGHARSWFFAEARRQGSPM